MAFKVIAILSMRDAFRLFVMLSSGKLWTWKRNSCSEIGFDGMFRSDL